MSYRVQIFILTLMKCGRGYSLASLCRIKEMRSLLATVAPCIWQPLSPLEGVVEGQAAASFHRQAIVNYTWLIHCTRPATTALASIMGCHIRWHFASIVARHNCFELSVERLRQILKYHKFKCKWMQTGAYMVYHAERPHRKL